MKVQNGSYGKEDLQMSATGAGKVKDGRNRKPRNEEVTVGISRRGKKHPKTRQRSTKPRNQRRREERITTAVQGRRLIEKRRARGDILKFRLNRLGEKNKGNRERRQHTDERDVICQRNRERAMLGGKKRARAKHRG